MLKCNDDYTIRHLSGLAIVSKISDRTRKVLLNYSYLFQGLLFIGTQCSVQNDESLRGHCTNESRVRKRDKKVRRDGDWRERGNSDV